MNETILNTMSNDPVDELLNSQTVQQESQPIPSPEPAPTPTEAEQDDAFSYDGYQVVRGEFFAHISEPSITFNRSKVSVNTACINKLPDVSYVQILVNPETRKLAIRPCSEEEKDAFLWCNRNTAKKKPKQITCRVFFAKIVQLMDWNPDYRYKLLGKLIESGGESLFVFNMESTEIYQRIIKDGDKVRSSRTPVFPADWQNSFGLPVEEHKKELQINIFDGYAVFGINETAKPSSETVNVPVQEEIGGDKE